MGQPVRRSHPALQGRVPQQDRQKYQGKGLLITSDEPWIPWEMVKPYEIDQDGNELYNDAPLCEKFQLTRRLAGRGSARRGQDAARGVGGAA